MGIRSKTIGLVTLIIVLLWAALLAAMGTFAIGIGTNSERIDVQQALDRARAGLDNDDSKLEDFVTDWSAWNQTYDFVRGRNPGYAESMLTTDTLSDFDVDFIVVVDPAGRVVGSTSWDASSHRKRLCRPVSWHIWPIGHR